MTLAAAIIPVTPFQQNCSLIWDQETKRGVVIDPGGDVARIEGAIAEAGITIDRILLTHGHMDHAGGAADLVLHCPGHTPGHVVFVNPDMGIAIVGDVLFQGSIGRTDFPYGDTAALLNAIRTKLFPLGDHIQFLCGHGPASSFGAERQSNPFVGENAP